MSISSINSSYWAAMLSQSLSLNALAGIVPSSSDSSTTTAQSIAAVSSNAAGDTLQLTEALPPLLYTYNSKGQESDSGAAASGQSAAQVFSSLDTNGDGTVSAEEFAAARPSDVTEKMAATLYNSLDTDRSGDLSEAEYTAGMSLKPEALGSQTGVMAAPPLAPGKVLSSLDTNGDGIVSAEEFAAARPADVTEAMATNLYSSLDTDSSGTLSADEYMALVNAAATVGTAQASEQEKFALLALLMPPSLLDYNNIQNLQVPATSSTTDSSTGSAVSA